jgi:hypothetical protein
LPNAAASPSCVHPLKAASTAALQTAKSAALLRRRQQ